uniref:Cytochrome P450 n=1 Tax=Araucaria cunninghamii TaxID=56994 RepID=A0A0D6QWU3_ARACU
MQLAMESWDAFATSIVGNNMWISIALATTLILCVLALAIGSAMVYGPLLLAVLRLKIKGNMPPLPPGSLGLPYWGESLNFINSWSNKSNPDVWYDMRRNTHGKIFKSHILGNPTVVLLGPEASRFILINENKLFRNGWPKSLKVLIGEHALVSSQGDDHKRMRRIIRSVLGQEALKHNVARFERIVVRHLDTCWQSGQIMRAHCEMKNMALSVVAEYLMGLKPGEVLEIFRRHFQDYSAGLLSHPLDLPWTVFGKAKRARTFMIAQICAQIKLRQTSTAANCGKADKEDNFLDAILSARKTKSDLSDFSDKEIAENFMGLLVGGQDTTAFALSTILSQLSSTPPSLERLRKECEKLRNMKRPGESLTWNEIKGLSYLRNVISEGLRLVAPVTGGFKQTKVDVVYRGYTIPKGWKVHYSMRQTNNKEEYFPNPERFDPDRFNNRHEPFSFIPFGQGNRICPGMEFAKLVMEVFLYHFILRFDWKLMEPDEPVNMQSLVAFPVHGLPLILKPVSSSSESTST